jgi:hypothetical protein
LWNGQGQIKVGKKVKEQHAKIITTKGCKLYSFESTAKENKNKKGSKS